MTVNQISSVEISHARKRMNSKEKEVVFTASLGTVFEMYDFFLMGLLANEIAGIFLLPASAILSAASIRFW
ncbi:hypothetical protein V1281_004680 [Nitrobacteraceae bacterium AZCC 2161]